MGGCPPGAFTFYLSAIESRPRDDPAEDDHDVQRPGSARVLRGLSRRGHRRRVDRRPAIDAHDCGRSASPGWRANLTSVWQHTGAKVEHPSNAESANGLRR